MLPDHSIQKVQPPGYVEQAVSIDPHVSRDKKKSLRTKKKKRRRQPDDHIDEPLKDNNNSEHIDYRA